MTRRRRLGMSAGQKNITIEENDENLDEESAGSVSLPSVSATCPALSDLTPDYSPLTPSQSVPLRTLQSPSLPPPPPPETSSRKNYGYVWVDADDHTRVYPTSVRGGAAKDGTQIYVGRAFHAGNWLPAKVFPEKNFASVSYEGKEVTVQQYQVLCEQKFDWLYCTEDNIPPNAVLAGKTTHDEPLYVGRVEHEGYQTVGKVHPSHRCCYIGFDGEEIAYANYEILVLQLPL